MRPVEIEEAVSALAEAAFDAQEFPYQFLEAFGNKATTIKRLKSGETNRSQHGGVLQTNNIHVKVAEAGATHEALADLVSATETTKYKAKFALVTDGAHLEAQELSSGETLACAYSELPDHFGFFLPLAGISTVPQIKENSFDIRATSRLNKLYVELLKENPDWATQARSHELNHFMARLIFCYFAEDTDIFQGNHKFSGLIAQMSDADARNTHEIVTQIFSAMNIPEKQRTPENTPRWCQGFPYVNGGLFAGNSSVPRFTKAARSYLIGIGRLDWTKINPDIFGSMIQAIADAEARSSLGMHYTSVPNILKVLSPLFLDELKLKLMEAGDNSRKLLNLRRRIAQIRVFDPACGSGNFLVIAYKELRALEAQINQLRSEPTRRSDIPLTNFRGIEINDFPAEVARLALVIAEYQCDVRYLGQLEALSALLPLAQENWIRCGNALSLDWLEVCPPPEATNLNFEEPLSDQTDSATLEFEHAVGETFICGNPPYLGSTFQSKEQKADLEHLFKGRTKNYKSLDYVSGWFIKAADYAQHTRTHAAFVSTNSICQGQQVPILWPLITKAGMQISFACTSFKWANLASHNAGVTVAIIGISNHAPALKQLIDTAADGTVSVKNVPHINAYLVGAPEVFIEKTSSPLSMLSAMTKGNQASDGGHLLLTTDEVKGLHLSPEQEKKYVRPFYGSAEFIKGSNRYCLWLNEEGVADLAENNAISQRLESVTNMRLDSTKLATQQLASTPFKFGEVRQTGTENTIIVPSVSSENREYLPTGYLPRGAIISNLAFALFDAPLWNLAIIASKLHLVWIGTVCGKLETRIRYSNTMGWNTFPIPKLTQKQQSDLTRCAEQILLAREVHFPATIADLYDSATMPDNLRAAHEHCDEVLERIYIGRRFKNDTERLEKLFELYGRMSNKERL